MDGNLCIHTSASVYYCRSGSVGIKEKTLMDGKKIKKLVIALLLVIVAGVAYLFLLNYSDKQKEAESQKEQEAAAASVVFETDTDEVNSISFKGDDGTLTFEKKNDAWICPDDSVFQMNENKIQKLLADISSVSCTMRTSMRLSH